MDISKSLFMQERAKKRIPGGTQLLSKRSEMFAPKLWPGYYSKAKGAEVWDLDGNKYIDMSICGIGANVLGFCDSEVDKAVTEAISNGNSSSLNCPEEVELADTMCHIHPWADMVRYARTGGESMAIAVRIARAHTGRDKIAFCGYHGWHDWYLAANLAKENSLDGHLLDGLNPKGVPRVLSGTALPFQYNDIASLKQIVADNKGELAAIVMEPMRSKEPDPGFLEQVYEVAQENHILLIFDEVSSAMRLNTGGVHLLFGIAPDIAVFAKAISNGYPMGIVIGKYSVMQSAQDTFISSTYWTERIGPVAALATINKHKRLKVAEHLKIIGDLVQKGWKQLALKNKLNINISGMLPLSHFEFEYVNKQEMMTLFVQMMLDQGFLASGRFYASYAHSSEHVNKYLESLDYVFHAVSKALRENKIKSLLKGSVCHSGFQRLT